MAGSESMRYVAEVLQRMHGRTAIETAVAVLSDPDAGMPERHEAGQELRRVLETIYGRQGSSTGRLQQPSQSVETEVGKVHRELC